jgi:ribosomal protein S18 acetylase RimI-like enzyme
MSPTGSPIFAKITPADVPDLFRVRTATRENVLSLDQLAALGITEGSVTDMLSQTHRGWLCRVGGETVGFAMGNRADGEMWVIAVLPEHERKGIGRELLRLVEDGLRSAGHSELWLTTDEDTSLRAYGFYRNAGWRDDGLRDGVRVMRKGRPIPKEYKKLHAEWYELASSKMNHAEEIEFLARCIGVSGEPVLELGSGTGRVLIPMLERGIRISGLDTSCDMLDRCRAACEAKGLAAELFEQSMLDFHIPRRLTTILLTSGGLGLFVRDEDIHAVFGRVRDHLGPGGLFLFEFEPVPAPRDEKRREDLWTGDWLRGPDDVILAKRQRNKYDPAAQVWERLVVFEKYVEGRLVETEANERVGRFFTVEEAVGFAEAAGFETIRVSGDYSEAPPTKRAKVVAVRCRKPQER